MENDGAGGQLRSAAILRAPDSPRAGCSSQHEMQSLMGRSKVPAVTPDVLVSQGQGLSLHDVGHLTCLFMRT